MSNIKKRIKQLKTEAHEDGWKFWRYNQGFLTGGYRFLVMDFYKDQPDKPFARTLYMSKRVSA